MDAFWEAGGPATSQNSLLKLEAGAEGREELILETAMDCNGPILSLIPSPSAAEPVGDDVGLHGAGTASILLDNSATHFSPCSHPMSSYYFENIPNFMPKI